MNAKDQLQKLETVHEDIALFRYGVIAPVLNGTVDPPLITYFRNVAEKPFEVPHYGLRVYSPITLRSWYDDFRRDGLDGLKPRRRADTGSSRAISEKIAQRIEELLAIKSKMPASVVREELVTERLITSPSPSETTIRRYIRSNGLRLVAESKRERRAFSKRAVNELWTIDFMHGPKLPASQLRGRPRLIGAIDDASRFLVLGEFRPTETYEDLAKALRNAFERHGLPQAIYCDNGSAFVCRDLKLACVRLGIALIHSLPGDASSRGKIERFFRTVRDRFLTTIDENSLDLAALNAAFGRWLTERYHRRIHSSLGVTPLDRFLADTSSRRWVSRQELDLHFHRTIRRKVRKDCTVSIAGVRYETSAQWIGMTVEIRSPLDDPGIFILFSEGDPAGQLKTLDPQANDDRNTRARFAASTPDDHDTED